MQAGEFLGALRFGQGAANGSANARKAPRVFDYASAALARPQPIARTRLQHPVAVCTRCNAFSFDPNRVGEHCSRENRVRSCSGVFALSRSSSEWQKCDDCHGTGWHAAMVCMQCQSLGWRFFRNT